MKNKIYKICGVALALVLVFSLFGAFVPANTPTAEAQAYTPNQWNTMVIPDPGGRIIVTNSNVVDFAVAADGKTIYLIDDASWGVAKSTNGGRTWSWLFGTVAGAPPLPAGPPAMAAAPTAIAVAPDDPNVVALIEGVGGGNDVVWITTNGGATWASLGIPRAVPSRTEVLSDIAVSPARAGIILGRDFAVSSYNTAAIATPGDIYVCGTTAAWAAVATGAGLAYDFTSLALAPNWVGDRVVLGVGSDATLAGNIELGPATTGDSYLVPINVATTVPSVPAPGTVSLDAAGVDSPAEITGLPAATDGEIVFSSISLPADFDSTSVGGFRAFVGWTSSISSGAILCADDAYRVDFNSVRKLEVRAAIPIYSVSFFGTVAGGTLMVGSALPPPAGGVWFTSDPQVSMPSWGAGSAKPPTGAANFIVALTSDTDAFACASGGNGAFSYTTDGGLSFNGCSFIDEALITAGAINDVMPAPDGSAVFMATEDVVSGNHSLWRCYGMPGAGKWDRVGFQTAALFTTTGSIVRLSPEYLTDTTVYWFDLSGTRIRRSTTEGQMWGTRTGSVSVDDAAVESQNVLYTIAAAGGNVYTSTNGGWFFGLPTGPGLGPLWSIACAPSYPEKPIAGNVLVGAQGAGVGLSTDGAASFRPLLSFVAGATFMQVYGDKDYATNNLIYAGSNTAGQGIFRFEDGVSTAWEQIQPVVGTMTGLASHCGVLYGAWDVAGTPYSGAERALYPTAPAPLWQFETMDMPLALMGDATPTVGADFSTTPSSLRACGNDTEVILYAIDTVAPALMAYIDQMAKIVPTASLPAEVLSDPLTSRNSAFIISWNQISNATAYDVDICLDSGCTQRANRWTPAPIANPAVPQLFVAAGQAFLSAGKDYYVRVCARDQVPGDAISSDWSEIVTLTIVPGVPVQVIYLGPQPLGPVPGATGVPLSPGFTWSPYVDTTKYEFKLAKDAALTDILAEAMVATTAYSYDGTLANNTTYFWAVRGVEPAVTDWGPVSSFTTEKKPVPPVVVEPTPAPPVPEPVVTPGIIWAIIAIGAILVIAVIVLILRTRRVA